MSAAPATPHAEAATVLHIEHATDYDYAAPVALAHHLAWLHPLSDATQQCLAAEITIEPKPAHREQRRDSFGNDCLQFALVQPHRHLSVVLRCKVQLQARFAGLQAAASPAWEKLRDRLHYVARAPYVLAVEFAQPSPRVPLLPALAEWAAASFTPGRPAALAAIELMQRLHNEFSYASDATEVDTPLDAAFAQRSGVCQDFSHVLIGALRSHGLPARYVSGYVRPLSSSGDQVFVGAQASHAWVQVWVPGTPGLPAGEEWLDLDPTNDCIPSTDHVRLAVGRDYGDVTPLRGVIRGGGQHSLSVAVQVRAATV
jgi:transglutaminase-like putative cysteine protease